VFALAIATPDDLADLQADLGDAVTLLADPEGQAVEAFGMIDPSPFPPRTLARSGTYYVDRNGQISARWLPESYRSRPDPDEVVAALRRTD